MPNDEAQHDQSLIRYYLIHHNIISSVLSYVPSSNEDGIPNVGLVHVHHISSWSLSAVHLLLLYFHLQFNSPSSHLGSILSPVE